MIWVLRTKSFIISDTDLLKLLKIGSKFEDAVITPKIGG